MNRRELLALGAAVPLSRALAQGASNGGRMSDGSRDFDFFIGKWNVRHRRLKARLAGSREWEEFGGTAELRTILGGSGNIDDNLLELPGGNYRAITLRSYDPATKTWAIWWLDGRNPHQLDVPMKGRFENGTGLFFADDVFEGKPIKVRFIWTAGTAPRWEQAFSGDGGKTWETNWLMEFTRAA
jgi:hypothetical protein